MQNDVVLLCRAASSGWFNVGFVGIGLSTDVRKLKKAVGGGGPVFLYLAGELFNIVLTFGASYLAFGLYSRDVEKLQGEPADVGENIRESRRCGGK